MQALMRQLTSKKAQGFAEQIGQPFKGLPHLPKNLVDLLVKLAPFFALIGAVLSLFASPILGLLSIASVVFLNPFLVLSIFVTGVIALLNALLLFLAFKPLQAREQTGWMLMFWSNMLSIIQTIYHLFYGGQGIGSILGILIGLYFLYELRPAYKK